MLVDAVRTQYRPTVSINRIRHTVKKKEEEEAEVTPAKLVDEYAQIKAQLAELGKREAQIKKELIALGDKEIEGATHKVTLSLVQGRETTDVKALYEFLHIGADIVAQFTKRGDPYYTLRVYGR